MTAKRVASGAICVLVPILVLCGTAFGIESAAFQMKEDYGCEPLQDEHILQYYYYVPCPSFSWFWGFYDWSCGDIIGQFFTIGDMPTGGHTVCDPVQCRSIDGLSVLDFAGYGTSYPGYFTVRFDVYCSDEAGCPVGPVLWTSGPVETQVGWTDVVIDPPVGVGDCFSDPGPPPSAARVLVTATHIGTMCSYPQWGLDNVSRPVIEGCAMHDISCLPVLYPRPRTSHYATIHTGYYGTDSETCPPQPILDPNDHTPDGTHYGHLELAWKLHVQCAACTGVYRIPEGPEAWAGQYEFIVPIAGSNACNIKGYSIAVKFDPAVFEPGSPPFDTTGTVASGTTIAPTYAAADTSATFGVVYSAECPPQIAAGEHPPERPFVKLVLRVKPTAPTGPTRIEFVEVGSSGNRMAACSGESVIPVCYDGTVEIRPAGFIRGDDNGDGEITIDDPILSLCAQFAGCELSCLDASDVDDDGEVTISDASYNLSAQFAFGPSPPEPFPGCGPDPTGDDLDCQCHGPCMACAGSPAEPAWSAGRRVDEPTAVGEGWQNGSGTGKPPAGISLSAGPNPSAEGALVEFTLPIGGPIRVELYDVAGRHVRTIARGEMPPGGYAIAWDGMDKAGMPVPNGVYFCSVTMRELSETVKLLVVR
jgi:hypothetical protein